jgi:hypothetical protein
MLLLTIVILIILMVYLLTKNITVASLLKNNTKEQFLITVKDRQKVGTVNNEDGKQPKSTWKSGGINYESCYSTETRNGNTTGRHHTYYCDNGVDAGEVIPAEGLYSIDFTNYKIYPGKTIRGKALTGIYSFSGKTHTLNSNGIVVNPNEKLTLAQSKSFCDSLKDKCEGFIMIIPTKGSQLGSHTIFISKLDEGWEDPDTYAKITKQDIINTNFVSYVKKDVNAVEKAVPQERLNAVSSKYQNLATCNWKSVNRCIFKDYTYDQSSNSCVSKDGNPAYNIAGYNQDQLKNWLDTLYRRDSGANKLTSEAVNVNEYIQRCKEVDGYEFLAGVSLPNPYIPTTKPGDVKGRYVRLTINNVNDNWLNFAELQVISDNRNIAVGKPASASSTYYGTPPSRGNDGNSLGEWSNNSVAHNDNTGAPEYWEVDLGDASRTIDRIIISNRTDCCGGRLNNWLLSIYDYNKNLIWGRIYKEAPNPTVSIDILNANNDMNNIRVKDYSQSRFNKYFHRVSDTEYNSKRGWDGKGCYDTCHKEICEGERKKWIGNSNWYGCREYKSGEYEAEQAEIARLKNNRFIPIFNKDSNEATGSDGVYKIDIRNGSYYPCINIGPGTYKNTSYMGVLLDNDITTGVDIEQYHIGSSWLPYIIVITLPVEKAFKGKFKLDLLSPWGGHTLPRKISLATFNRNAFSQNWWGNHISSSYNMNDLPHRLENIDLPEVGNGISTGPFNYSFDINFTRPFKYIALIIHSGWNQTGSQQGKSGAIWINSLNFENDSNTSSPPANGRCARMGPTNYSTAGRIYGDGPGSGCPVNAPDSFCCSSDGGWREPVNDGRFVWYYDEQSRRYFHY